MSALDDISKILKKEDGEQQPAQTSEQQPAQTSEQQPAQTSEQKPAQTSEQQPAQTSEQQPAQTSEQQPAQTSEQQPAQTSEQKPAFSIADYISKYHPYSEQNMDKKQAELERKKKRDSVMAAIGDGLNAFQQAYAYSRGIKPLTENKSQSKAVRDKYDALDKEREAHKAEYLNAYIRGLQEDEENKNKKKDQALKERQQTRLEEDTRIRAAKAEAYSNYQASVIAKNEAQASYWQEKANALEAGASLEEAIKRAERARKEAQARASDAAAEKYKADTEYRNKQAGLLGQATTTSVTRKTTDEKGKEKTVQETRTTTKGGSGSGNDGKKKLPGKTKTTTTKKQLP